MKKLDLRKVVGGNSHYFHRNRSENGVHAVAEFPLAPGRGQYSHSCVHEHHRA